MDALRYLTAGESHGPALTAIMEGMPAGMELTAEDIDKDLARRQTGYGRGRRMQIEKDRIRILSGVRLGWTLGSPISLQVGNDDFKNWRDKMSPGPVEDNETGLTAERVSRPRPGHADLAGAQKYGHRDLRNVLERASARETTVRVAVGAVAKKLLATFGMTVIGHVVAIGGVQAAREDLSYEQIAKTAENDDVRCADAQASTAMKTAIDKAKAEGDTLGGVFEVMVLGVPPGLGSHVHWDRKLDGRLAQALMSVQAIKAVEIGLGQKVADRPGSRVHDPIAYDSEHGFYRTQNNAGGIEGGMSNGEPIVVRAAMKPIATLYKPLPSVDFYSKEAFEASIERSDACAVPAASVVGEAVVAFEIARAFLEKFGGDSIQEITRNLEGYTAYLREI